MSRHRTLAICLLPALGLAWIGWTLHSQAEIRTLFAPRFGRPETEFDVSAALFDGKPVADLLQTALHGSPQEREFAVFDLAEVHHGCGRLTMHSGDCGRPREERTRMLQLVRRGVLGPRARAILPTLLHTINDPVAKVRSATAYVFMEMEAEALSACDALMERLTDSDTETRLWSARALYSIRFETEAPIQCATDALLHDSNPRMRSMAAYNLELMGQDASPAVGALQQALSDPESDVRRQAQQALTGIR